MALIRTCACGCKLTFEVSEDSKKTYLNLKHSQHARDFRRKLKKAGVEVVSSQETALVTE